MKVHGPVVVAMNEQDRRFPDGHCGNRRRFIGHFQRLSQIRFGNAVADYGVRKLLRADGRHTVVDAVHVHAGSKHVGVAAERHCSEIPAQ